MRFIELTMTGGTKVIVNMALVKHIIKYDSVDYSTVTFTGTISYQSGENITVDEYLSVKESPSEIMDKLR